MEELCRLRLARKQKYPVIIAQFSVMKQNAHEVDAYRTYWEARGAEVKVRPMLEWTATGTVRTDTIVHDSEFRIACPWGNNTMAIHQDGSVVCCAVDYEGKVKVGNVGEITVKEAWRRLGERVRRPHLVSPTSIAGLWAGLGLLLASGAAVGLALLGQLGG